MKKFILDKLETPENILEYATCIIDITEGWAYLTSVPSILQEGVQALCLAGALA